MEQVIVEFAKKLGVLPLEMDMETQIFLNDMGTDPSQAKKKYAKGLSKDASEICCRVQSNIGKLHHADNSGNLPHEKYSILERAVKSDLARLGALAERKTGLVPFIRYGL